MPPPSSRVPTGSLDNPAADPAPGGRPASALAPSLPVPSPQPPDTPAPLTDEPASGPSSRPAGRPYGARSAVQAPHQVLRHTHFAYVRFALHGVPLREAWLRCLAFSGGPDDERHFQRRLREIVAWIRTGAAGRGLSAVADTALRGLPLRHRHRATGSVDGPAWPRDAGPSNPEVRPAAASLGVGSLAVVHLPTPVKGSIGLGQALPPALDEWIAQRCATLGIDSDFQTQADWLAEYQDVFGLDLAARARDQATAIRAAHPTARDRAELDPAEAATSAVLLAPAAVPWAHTALGAALGDPETDGELERSGEGAARRAAALRAQLAALGALASALAVPPALADALATWLAPALCARLRLAGVSTLQDLAEHIDRHGHRWWRRVPGVGAARAGRLVAWLAPLAEQLGRPLTAAAQQPARALALARAGELARLDPLGLQRYGLVPLPRLAVPPELSGRGGTFRSHGPNTLGAQDDLQALQAWLARHAASPQTHRAYFHALELFYLWCVWERRVALGSLVERDLLAFRDFVSDPPARWIQPRAVSRDSADWRPLRGPMSERSQRLLFAAVKSLFAGLVAAGYLTADATRGLRLHWTQGTARLGVRRALSQRQWDWILATLAARADTPERRRLQLVLELAVTTGLRRAELAGARRGHLRQEWLDGPSGPPTWFLEVLGKGRRQREVVIAPHVMALIEQHQADQQATVPAGVAVDASERPLIGALRVPPGRLKPEVNGRSERAVNAPKDTGALEVSALYQALKRLFERAARSAHAADPPLDGNELRRTSTHWLRHTFAMRALERGVSLVVVRDVLGHADLATTSIYLRTEMTTMARELSKLHKPA